jgi:hypothetical protein
VKEEVVEIVIKTEGEPNQYKYVTLIKSEDDNFDVWNVDGFDLGQPFLWRKNISEASPGRSLAMLASKFAILIIHQAFGGGQMACNHHWKTKAEERQRLLCMLHAGTPLILNS